MITEPTIALELLADLPALLESCTVEVRTREGTLDVPAFICADFDGLAVTAGLPGEECGWSITHIESDGEIPIGADRLETNLVIAAHLATIVDWTLVDAEGCHTEGVDVAATVTSTLGHYRHVCEILEPDHDES